MDALDERIVACLATDGRMSFANIGAAVGLSAPAVKRRVDRMRADGTIRGFTVVVDPTAAGARTEAFVELTVGDRAGPGDIARIVESRPEVVAAYTVTGDADALVHVRTGTIAELERAIEQMRTHPDVERTKSIVVLSRLVDRLGPLAPVAPER